VLCSLRHPFGAYSSVWPGVPGRGPYRPSGPGGSARLNLYAPKQPPAQSTDYPSGFLGRARTTMADPRTARPQGHLSWATLNRNSWPKARLGSASRVARAGLKGWLAPRGLTSSHVLFLEAGTDDIGLIQFTGRRRSRGAPRPARPPARTGEQRAPPAAAGRPPRRAWLAPTIGDEFPRDLGAHSFLRPTSSGIRRTASRMPTALKSITSINTSTAPALQDWLQ
jgi:hypothetical protein